MGQVETVIIAPGMWRENAFGGQGKRRVSREGCPARKQGRLMGSESFRIEAPE